MIEHVAEAYLKRMLQDGLGRVGRGFISSCEEKPASNGIFIYARLIFSSSVISIRTSKNMLWESRAPVTFLSV